MTIKKKEKKPWPTKDAMEQIYEEHLWGGSHTDFYSGVGSHEPQYVTPYLQALRSFLSSFEVPPVVCDLGCGDFNVGKRLVKDTARYIGVDIVEELIDRNRQTFSEDGLEFHCLDIAKDDLPPANCAILRQVLQHLSNNEIQSVVSKFWRYPYIVVTEHIPEGDFEPNKDIISGQGIRLKKNSGVDLLAPPFNLKIEEKRHLLTIPYREGKGIMVTMLYKTNTSPGDQ